MKRVGTSSWLNTVDVQLLGIFLLELPPFLVFIKSCSDARYSDSQVINCYKMVRLAVSLKEQKPLPVLDRTDPHSRGLVMLLRVGIS